MKDGVLGGMVQFSLSGRRLLCEREESLRLLAQGFSDFFGQELDRGAIQRAKRGKPYYGKDARVQFNVSHCRRGAAAAVSNRPVGVDMECMRRVRCAAAAKCCSQRELSYVFGGEGPRGGGFLTEPEAKRFLRLWTLKESYVKMTGEGICIPLAKISFDVSDASLREGRPCPVQGPDGSAAHFLFPVGEFVLALSAQKDAEGACQEFEWRRIEGSASLERCP